MTGFFLILRRARGRGGGLGEVLVQDLPPQRGGGGGRGGGQPGVGHLIVLDVAGGGHGADGHPCGAARHVRVLRDQRAQDQPLLPTKLPLLKVQPSKV